MLGLCTICGDPVLENKQYCHDCQKEIDTAYDDVMRGARQSNPNTEPIRQQQRKRYPAYQPPPQDGGNND